MCNHEETTAIMTPIREINNSFKQSMERAWAMLGVRQILFLKWLEFHLPVNMFRYHFSNIWEKLWKISVRKSQFQLKTDKCEEGLLTSYLCCLLRWKLDLSVTRLKLFIHKTSVKVVLRVFESSIAVSHYGK